MIYFEAFANWLEFYYVCVPLLTGPASKVSSSTNYRGNDGNRVRIHWSSRAEL